MAILLRLKFSAGATLAFVIACGFVADTTSLPLVISNLVNIVSANFFGIGFDRYAAVMVPVNLVAGEQAAPANRALNPQGLVPTLVVDGRPLVQSLAIVDWLDANFDDPPMVSKDPFVRAGQLARALVEVGPGGLEQVRDQHLGIHHAPDHVVERDHLRVVLDVVAEAMAGAAVVPIDRVHAGAPVIRPAIADAATVAGLPR
jgi:glutathione S-transferase